MVIGRLLNQLTVGFFYGYEYRQIVPSQFQTSMVIYALYCIFFLEIVLGRGHSRKVSKNLFGNFNF